MLTATALFTVLLVFLPFSHSYNLMIAMALLGGLTSGTFYPLTRTFALRLAPSGIPPYCPRIPMYCGGWNARS